MGGGPEPGRDQGRHHRVSVPRLALERQGQVQPTSPTPDAFPTVAKTRAWTTLERNGQLYVWNDPQGNPPPADVTIPEIAGYGTDEWTDWSWKTLRIKGSHCREIVDNVVDMAHFFYIHYSFPRYFKTSSRATPPRSNMHSTGREDIVSGTNYDDPTPSCVRRPRTSARRT